MRGKNNTNDKLMGSLEIRDMVFYANHGLYPEEQQVGGRFSVSCWMSYEVNPISSLDTLDQTIDYQEVFELVSHILEKRVNLIETLAKAIFDKVIEEYPRLTFLKIRVEKHRPPIKGLGMTAFELSSSL